MARIAGKPVGKVRNSDEALRRRLLRRVLINPETGCWEWRLSVNVDGYGRFWDGKSNTAAHRTAYQLFVGPIPEEMVMDHLCRNPKCVNPAHLEPVTVMVNTMRGLGPAATNAKKTHCKNGHPFSPDNTHIDTKGKRVRRKCANEKRWNEHSRKVAREYQRKRSQQKRNENRQPAEAAA